MNHPTSGTGPDTAAKTGTGTETEAGIGVGAEAGIGDTGDTGRRLRAAFAEAAYQLTPPPVPLEAIEREGRSRRRRRRAAALSTGCGLLLLPLVAVLALRPDDPSATVRPMAPPNPKPSTSASPPPTRLSTPVAGLVRVVEPGEKVRIGDGTRIWLTEEGKYGDTPGVSEVPEFRSVVDGNIDMSRPGVSVQETPRGAEKVFLTGVYHGGPNVAAGVRIELYDGRIFDGTVVRLARTKEWGGWYLLATVGEGVSNPEHMRGITRKVTVYDKDGGVVASQDLG
ncbi:hypothetical protein RM704_40030 [Streptomyces sp. DSM 3412]|uniref:Uncharacterized protein n=1 Tax=Streptomyces gottesmaniae TaxID=3075518 RepID=A0ABU2ZAD7_9ACTN|nr:hypothetical protein [Streptomyces sp. DSM 3412]MDT0573562.1 hypothetical protein [Streptomyces sp. DSM 3412]